MRPRTAALPRFRLRKEAHAEEHALYLPAPPSRAFPGFQLGAPEVAEGRPGPEGPGLDQKDHKGSRGSSFLSFQAPLSFN